MTVEKLLETVDSVKENSFCDDVKLGWIGDVEGRVLSELHGIKPEDIKLPKGGEDTLTVPDAYARLYLLYLVAMMELCGGNYSAYSQANREFESAYAMYARYVIRNR